MEKIGTFFGTGNNDVVYEVYQSIENTYCVSKYHVEHQSKYKDYTCNSYEEAFKYMVANNGGEMPETIKLAI